MELVKVEKLLTDMNIPSSVVSPLLFVRFESREQHKCARPLHVLLSVQQSSYNNFKQILATLQLSRAVWLMFFNGSLEEFFFGINIPYDCEFLVVQQVGSISILTEVYRIAPNLPLQTSVITNWTTTGDISWPEVGFYDRRSDFQGFDLNVGVNNDSLTVITNTSENGDLQVGGLFGEMWHVMERYKNFTSHYCTNTLNSHGELQNNGTWNGIVGMLQTGQVDVSCADLTMTTPRIEVVDFIEPLWNVRAYIFIKKPNSVPVGWNTFLMPYKFKMWLSIVVAVVLINLCCFALHYLRPRGGQTVDGAQHDGMGNIVICIVACLCWQGISLRSHLTSHRILHISAYLLSIILHITYSASLFSCITSRDIELPFTNFQEFLNDGTYKFGVVANSSIITNMKESTERPLQKLYESILPTMSSLPQRNNEGLRRVCDDDHYAYMSPQYVLLTSAASCTLATVPHAYIPSTKAMAVVKNSPYLLQLRYILRSMQRSGILHRIYSDTLISQPQQQEPVFQVVNVETVVPFMAILLFGIGMSMLMLMLEKKSCHGKFRQAQRNHGRYRL